MTTTEESDYEELKSVLITLLRKLVVICVWLMIVIEMGKYDDYAKIMTTSGPTKNDAIPNDPRYRDSNGKPLDTPFKTGERDYQAPTKECQAATSTIVDSTDDGTTTIIDLNDDEVLLHNNEIMPIISLGTAHFSLKSDTDEHARFQGFLPEKAYRQIELALEAGIRNFDTALIYGTQKQLGHVLGNWFASGKIKERKELYITTKVHHKPAPGFGLERNHQVDYDAMTDTEIGTLTTKHIEQSLHELGIGYIDLLLMHWPSGETEGSFTFQDVKENRRKRLATWKVFEEFYNRGWVKSIGVSNFADSHIAQLLHDGATIVPMVNQIEASPYIQYSHIVQYCKKKNIRMQAYSPLGNGRFNFRNDKVLLGIANQHYGKDVGQIVFRYLIQLGYTITFLTNSFERMKTNQQLFDFKLSHGEMEKINALNQPHVSGTWGLPSPNDLP